ncbi:hypothetical protein NPIL_163861 [Nephila pilipes]|uniref:Uncharacterized protein n=1 Tax=Nephila pilipes TaxID=299642 RepID=A0A8X6Q225_NEPPI|nr:hypothetical protein NPIL_163861 [Nephila pilipes]
MDKFLRRKDSSSRTDDEEPSTSVTKNLKKEEKKLRSSFESMRDMLCRDYRKIHFSKHLKKKTFANTSEKSEFRSVGKVPKWFVILSARVRVPSQKNVTSKSLSGTY